MLVSGATAGAAFFAWNRSRSFCLEREPALGPRARTFGAGAAQKSGGSATLVAAGAGEANII